jgi:hypothetical protein
MLLNTKKKEREREREIKKVATRVKRKRYKNQRFFSRFYFCEYNNKKN